MYILATFGLLLVLACSGNRASGSECKIGSSVTSYGTYHNYDAKTPETVTSCQLPMKIDSNGILRVTAANEQFYQKGRNCGNCVLIENLAQGGKSYTAMIVDEKGAPGLDIATNLFQALDNPSKDGNAAGRMNIKISTVPCTGLVNKLKYRFKAGSMPNGWFVISIVDHLLPITNVYVSQNSNGPWHECKYSSGVKNYYDCAGHSSYTLPMAIKVKAVDGQEVVDSLTKITPESSPLSSPLNKQFAVNSDCSKHEVIAQTTVAPSPTNPNPTEESTGGSGSISGSGGSTASCGITFTCVGKPLGSFHMDPCSCHSYYQCAQNDAAVKNTCPSPLVWDQGLKNCNWKHGAIEYNKDNCS